MFLSPSDTALEVSSTAGTSLLWLEVTSKFLQINYHIQFSPSHTNTYAHTEKTLAHI